MLLGDKVCNLLLSSLNPEGSLFHHWYSAFLCGPSFDYIPDPVCKPMQISLTFCILNTPHCEYEIMQTEGS